MFDKYLVIQNVPIKDRVRVIGKQRLLREENVVDIHEGCHVNNLELSWFQIQPKCQGKRN